MFQHLFICSVKSLSFSIHRLRKHTEIMTFKVETVSSSSTNNSNISLAHTSIYCLSETFIDVLVVATIIFPINICALWHAGKTMTKKKRYSSSDVLNLNLVINSVIFFPPPVIYYVSFNLSNTILFTTAKFLTITCTEAQAYFQTWICVEQYLAVVYPIFYLKLKQFRYVFVLVGFTWIVSFVLGGLFVVLGFKHGIFVLIIPISVLFVPMLFCSVATLASLKQNGPSNGKKKDAL